MKIETGKHWGVALILGIFCISGICAQERDPELLDVLEKPGIENSTILDIMAATTIELKAILRHNITAPFLAGEGVLTRGNNIRGSFVFDITPVSLNASAEAVWTPLAILQLTAGMKAGSGWSLTLGNFSAYGIGKNVRVGAHEEGYSGSPFEGLIWSGKAGAALQFDFAALFPGDWNHVVVRAYNEFFYRANTAANSTDSWYFENDFGENRNGWKYYASYLLGYQMPIFFNTFALLAELEKNLYNTPGGDAWGDSLGYWKLAGLFNFTITKWFSAALIVQFRSMRNYTPATKDYFYQDRVLVTSDPRRFEFYRAAINVTFTF